MLRIVLGYRQDGRESTPEVLYCGHDADAAQAATDTADAAFARVEIADITHVRRGKKRAATLPSPATGTAPIPAAEPLAASGDGSGESEAAPAPVEEEADPASEIASAAGRGKRRP